MDNWLGRTIAGKYRVDSKLGAGGMGTVYQARHLSTGGDVAIKFLHGGQAGTGNAAKRFALEAQNAAQLKHAHTIRVLDFGKDAISGALYLVIEHLSGQPLSALIAAEAPLEPARAIRILSQILKSLWEAHEHALQIVHRDIKPANIFLLNLPGEPDFVKVLDFGIARSLTGDGAGTQGIIGSPFYMAPELWRGEVIDPRTDLYAVGCVAFEMLAGRPPFVPPPSAADALLPLMGMHVGEPPPPLLSKAPQTPHALAAWVDRLLTKDPAGRPDSAQQALAGLREMTLATGRGAASLPATATPDPATAPIPKGPSKAAAKAAPVVTVTHNPQKTNAARPQSQWLLIAIAVVVVGLVIGFVARPDGSQTQSQSVPTEHDIAMAPATKATTTGASKSGDSTLVVSGPARGKTQIGRQQFSYRARLSAADHSTPRGAAHPTAARILAQDRANFHHFGKRDAQDQSDPRYADVDYLEQLAPLLDNVVLGPVAQAILHGTPLVEVTIYASGARVQIVSE